MAFTSVPTYVTNQLITAAHANTYWRDNLNELFPHTAIGDLTYADTTSSLAALALGNTGHVLRSNGTTPVWDAIERTMPVRVVPIGVPLTIGDDAYHIFIPNDLNGCNLADADACIDEISTGGVVTIQIRNVTKAVDMLSTPITIDEGEDTSYTAATQPAIDTNNDGVETGNKIAIDVDGNGTNVKGLVAMLRFELP